MASRAELEAVSIELVNPDRLEDVIELDAEISWEFVDERVKSSMSYEEYKKRHRELFFELLHEPGEHVIFGAFVGGRLVGIAWAKERWDTVDYVKVLYLLDLEVRQEFRGRGIGSKLMEAVERYCREKGYPKVVLRVEVTNEDAMSWYESLGFRRRAIILEKFKEDASSET